MADDPWAVEADHQELSAKMGTVNISVPRTLPQVMPQVTPHQSEDWDDGPQAANNAAPSTTGAGDWEEDKGLSKADASALQKLIRRKITDTKSQLEIERQDPKSPLHSVRTFEALRLKPELLKGIYDMGFNAPSKIQETALPILLCEPPQNMIAQSQSGTGKTAAFVLTMLMRVDTNLPYPQCLCLAPTYELALQIGEVTRCMGKHMSQLQIGYAVRGGERVNRGQMIHSHIVIGTPGTMLDWAMRFKVFDLKKVKVFVLDEADVMIDTQGHQDQSVRLQKGLGPNCQILLFSATYDDGVMKFARQVVSEPVVIKLRREEESLDNIKQYYIDCHNQEAKYEAVANIYGSISIGQSMIFCHTRKTAGWLAGKMMQDGHSVALLSGELTVEQRADIINRFKEGKEKVLITTNVSARGIDVEQVTVVVNFDLPIGVNRQPDCETYLHRIGRTGRFGKSGLAINLVDGPQSKRVLEAFADHFGRSIVKLDSEDPDALEKIGQ